MRGRVISANPEGFDATAENVLPGDVIVDPSGTSSLVGVVVRTGPTRADQVVRIFQAVTATGDTLTVVESGVSPTRILTITVRDPLGNVRANAMVLLGFTTSLAMLGLTVSTGSGTVVGSALEQIVYGRCDAGGVIAVSITGTPADTIGYRASSLSVTPGAAGGSSVIP